jgi:glyceraldehyde-3-phosphate dehydrogenase (NADP+)
MADLTSAPAARFPTADSLPERFRYTPDDTGRRLLVDGELISWAGETTPIRSAVCVRDAAGTLTQVELGPAAAADADLARAAVDAAARAWRGGRGDWPRASVEERIACVEAFAERARAVREQVALALLWEVGKPWLDCLSEVDRTLEYMAATVDMLRQVEREHGSLVAASGHLARIRRAPIGVALCMGPFNYAINEVYTTVIPALIMGNPVVTKTPRYGVLANALLAPALQASFPPGVVNLITGHGPTVVGPIMQSGLVDVLAFIGAHKTADTIQRQHPLAYRLRSVLGLGAKNPAIVLADADLDLAAREIVAGGLTFNGQRCTAIKHVLVVREVADALVERLAARLATLAVGMPWEDGVTVTPLPDPRHPAYLAGLVADAVAKGARVVNPVGGEHAGTLFHPALVVDVPSDAALFSVEQFGPVIPVSVVADHRAALDVVDRSSVGQQASVFGQDAGVLGEMVDHLANLVCRVNLDTQCRRSPDTYPFTGRKDSAFGTLSVYDALRSFSLRSMVTTPAARGAHFDRLATTSRFLAPASGSGST